MEDILMNHVSAEHLDELLDAVQTVLADIKELEPEAGKRLNDESYVTLLTMNMVVFGALSESLKNAKK